ncbi:Cas1p-domain-containing protein [Venturia nashicola]|uniref:Cas1p-domain-containing protein n=1 Tax=Venturia nashicola TaxID=86259 RepID=A0A4Z1NW16_9PEZI|nr:Cas1p-domain-containing protein [Venturia nashicola]
MPRANTTLDNQAVSKLLQTLFAFLLAFVLLSTLHRRYWSDSHDPYKCSVLLNEGQWLDEPISNPSRRHYQKWQPSGCLLKEYKRDDITPCAGNRQLLFIGDSNVRQLFWAVAKKLDRDMSSPAGKYAERHGDIQLRPRGVDLRFVWDPYLNGSILTNELEIYQESVLPTGKAGKAEVPAVIMVLGGGLWHARQYGAEAVREFKKAVDSITSLTTRRDGSEWRSEAPFKGWEGIGDQVFFMPVEEPIYKRLSPARQVSILPEEVDQMNEYLRQLKPSQGITIPWVNQVMTSKRPFAYEASGLHVIEPITNRRVDVLLNLRCNAKVDNAVGSPYDRTCCSKYTSGNWFQWTLIALTLAVSMLAACLHFCGYTTIDFQTGKYNAARAFTSIASIGLSLAYCFFADRSQLFNKVQKMYQSFDLLTICAIVLTISLLTIRKSKESIPPQEVPAISKKDSSESKLILENTAASDTFLSSSQMLEWKGWTIAFLVLTRYYAADHEPWVHIVSRLCISCQLFLVGYEQTPYFYTTGDYNVRPVVTYVVRMNILAVAVAYQMYTNYLFYYIAPLLSFWFLVVWGTLKFGGELNGNVEFLLGKVAFSAGFVVMLHKTDQPINLIFDILRLIFGINWDGHDWRDHISTDSFIVYVGMLVALANIAHHHLRITAVTKPNNADSAWIQHLLIRALPLLPLLAISASLLTLPIFFYATLSSFVEPRGYDWDVNPYLSPLPVVAYLVLRNSTTVLRQHSSKALMTLGGCGVEIWVLSMHAWNSADGRGVLSSGVVGDRRVEGVVLGLVVLGIGVWVGRGSEWLTEWIVDGNGGEKVLPLVREKDVKISSSNRWLGEPSIRFIALLGGLWVLNLVTG